MLASVMVASALSLDRAEVLVPGYEVTVRAAGVLFVSQTGPSRGTVYAVEGIHVERSRLFGSFDQVIIYEWRDGNNDGVAVQTEFVPVQIYVDSPQTAIILSLVFSGIVQPVPAGAIQVSGTSMDREIQLRYGGSFLDLHIRSLASEEPSPLCLMFVNGATGWSFKAHGPEYPAEARGYAYIPGLLFGETPAESGAIKGFPSSGFIVPEAVIKLSLT